MAESVTKLPLRTDDKSTAATRAQKPAAWHPFESLRQQIDRVFNDFDHGFFRSPFGFARGVFDVEPFGRSELSLAATPVVDIVEHDKDYEINAELPGMDDSNVEVTLSDRTLTIKGEKKEEKEEKRKNAYVSERRYGSIQRSFRVPDGVDTDRIDAVFAKGVLKVTLPKNPEAQKKDRRIAVKPA